MKAIIEIDKTAAIVDGREVFGEIIVEFSVADVPEHLRPVLAAAPVNGSDKMIVLSSPVPCEDAYGAIIWHHATKEAPRPVLAHADDPLFAVVTWLQWRLDNRNALEAQARQQAEDQAAHQAALKERDQALLAAYVDYWSHKTPEEWLDAISRFGHVYRHYMPGGYHHSRSGIAGLADQFPEPPCDKDSAALALADQIKAAEELRDARLAEDKARQDAERQQAKEAAKARKATIAMYIEEYGTDSQRERQEAGLLDKEEALDAIGAALFASIDDFELFREARMDDLAHDEQCEAREDALEVTVAPVTELDADEWDLFKAIKDAAPEGATVNMCAKRYWCSECEAELTRVYATVEKVLGEGIGAVTLTERYQIGDRVV